MSEGRVIVTLSVFSGRANPRWELTESQIDQLRQRLDERQAETMSKPPGASYGLGYRGLLVELPGGGGVPSLHIHGGVIGTSNLHANHEDADRQLERWLLSTGTVGPDILDHVQQDLAATPQAVMAAAAAACPPCGGGAAPVYNPGPWNTPAVQPNNNCYNYATNMQTNTFAQPGRATGRLYPQPPACPGVNAGAVSDGLQNAATFKASIPNAFYVALVIWPGTDFHWYRQDKSGCWSHKPGHTPVRNVDNAGNNIVDPATANRGPYTQFCGYMTVAPGHVRIN